MQNQNNQIILKEGYSPLIISFAISLFLVIFISDFLANLGFLFILALLFIYRNPKRIGYIDKSSVIAPIDGKISAIDITKNSYKIYIDVNLCDAHILRSPIDSNYKVKSLIKGLNLNSASYKAKILNSRAILKFDDIKIKLISGICNSDIVLYENAKVNSTQAIGVFLNGLVIIEIPKKFNIKIKLNDKIYSGITTLA